MREPPERRGTGSTTLPVSRRRRDGRRAADRLPDASPSLTADGRRDPPPSTSSCRAFEETGYVVLDRTTRRPTRRSGSTSTYVDWKSSGDTRFAPLASAYGDMECNGFWNHTPPEDRQGRRLGRRERRRQAPQAHARAPQEPGAERRPLPRDRTAAATALRRLHLQPAPRRQQPAQPRVAPAGSCAGSSTSPTTRELGHDPARGQATTRRPSPHPAAGRRPAASSTPSVCGTPCGTRARAALLPDHLVGVAARSSTPTIEQVQRRQRGRQPAVDRPHRRGHQDRRAQAPRRRAALGPGHSREAAEVKSEA